MNPGRDTHVVPQHGSSAVSTLGAQLPDFVDVDSLPFWEGLNENQLRVQKCGSCGTLRWPARSHCNRCWTEDAQWSVASGRGEVYSWAVSHHPLVPALADSVPYVILLVRLVEQADLLLPSAPAAPGRVALHAGQSVRAVFTEPVAGQRFLTWALE